MIIIYEQAVWCEGCWWTDAGGRKRVKTVELQNFQRCAPNKTSHFGDTNRQTGSEAVYSFLTVIFIYV
jgi:hypothetical protein